MNHSFRLVFLISFVLSATTSQAAADLRLTSIVRNGECTTLNWVSHPGEFYTVYWTDNLHPPVFWRVAEVNVPSGGTNTTWSEGGCGEMMMMSGGISSSSTERKSLSEKEIAEMIEAASERAQDGAKFLMEKLEEATVRLSEQQGGNSLTASPSPDPGGGGGTNYTTDVFALRFYRVARTAVSGFVDGWWLGFGLVPEVFTNVVAVPAGLTNVFAVSASPRYAGAHSLAVRADGSVAAWGANGFGQCNVPTNLSDVVAVTAGGMHSVALTRSGSVVSWGNTSLGQVTNAPANLTNVVDVKAGLWHTLALRADGTVAAWGDLFNGTNSVPAGLSNVTAIAAGPRHCLALRCDGKVVAWGFTYDFLGNFLPTNVPASLSNVVAISAGLEHNEALLHDGTVVVWGNTNNYGSASGSALTNAVAVSAGWHYGSVLHNDTTVETWGQGENDLTMDSIVELSVGALHTLVVRTNNDAPVIKRHPQSSLFAAPGMATNLSVVASSGLALTYQWQRQTTSGWVNITGETSASLWFTNLQDADDGLYRVQVSTTLRSIFSRVATVETLHAPIIASQSPELNLHGAQFSYAALSVVVTNKGARLLHYQWFKDGSNAPISMGLVYDLPFNSTSVEGDYHVVVSNVVGSATSQVWHVSVTLRGEAATWGDTSQGQTNGFQRHETNLVAIACGGYHTLGLRENSTVMAWGYNNAAQTNVPAGLTNVMAIAAGGSHSMALLENGTVRAWGNNNSGQTNVPTGLTNVTALAAGGPQSMSLRADGSVVAWGGTFIPSGISNVSAIAAGPNCSLALMSNGTVQAWTDSGQTNLNPPSGLSNVVAIASGTSHALALRRDSTVVAWGANSYGETNVPAGLSNVLKIAAGGQFSMVLKNDGTIVSWGRNDDGQTNGPADLGDVYAISAGVSHSVSLTYEPSLNYPVNVAQDLLLLYNTNSSDSATLKDYYLAHRPFVSEANILGLGGYAGETSTNNADFTNGVLNVVLDWYQQNPTKRPRYLTCFLDVPTRLEYPVLPTVPTDGGSVGVRIQTVIGHRPPYVTYINMGAPLNKPAETNRLVDCTNYINKLAFFGSNYSPGKVVISASAGAYGNDYYFLDDLVGFGSNGPITGNFIVNYYHGLLASGVSSNLINFAATMPGAVRSGTNVAGYMSWGSYGYSGYAINEKVSFFEHSSWYIMATVESFNGIRHIGQGNYPEWFWGGAFNRTNYEGTPVGAVCHVAEPFLYGTQDGTIYFGLWAKGKYFSTCAWQSSRTAALLVVGDPLVRR